DQSISTLLHSPLLCLFVALPFPVPHSSSAIQSSRGLSRGGGSDGASVRRRSPGVRRRCSFLLRLLPVPGCCCGGDPVVRGQLRHHRRRGPRQDLPRRPDLVPLPRQQDGRWVPDEAEVPVRVVQHEAQARRERLRRRRHRLLHVLGPGRGAGARRAGLRVPGQPHRRAVHHPDERVPHSGVGGREMRHSLWFDPTAEFHSYSILWNPKQIV
uniref:GH16 domain-containing protein n=1 Tax=Aegilops tauschii subsp. strangulata TaxID=200361 RepID=A0A453BDC7_AEGTS